MNFRPDLPGLRQARAHTGEQTAGPAYRLRFMGREITLPRSRLVRMALGIAMVMLGILGFLPILGFWMVPVGLLILSYDIAAIRRLRRRFVLWWSRRRSR
jgi:hypothetical protein